MSDNPLAAFLKPRDISAETQDIIVTDFFKDENGEPIPFKIRAISDADNDRLKKSTKKMPDKSGISMMDWDEYVGRLVVACTVFPSFANTELCAVYGTTVPYQLPSRMLKSGEVKFLYDSIEKLCGFNNASQRILDEAKN
jgi:hypothetical protein